MSNYESATGIISTYEDELNLNQESSPQKFKTVPAFATKPEETRFKLAQNRSTSDTDCVYDPFPPESPRKIRSPDKAPDRSPRKSPRISNRSSNCGSTSNSTCNSSMNETLFGTIQRAQSPSLKDRALKMEPIFDLSKDQYENLLGELVDERKKLASSYNFRDSQKVTDAIKHVEACQIKQQKYELQVEAIHEYDELVADFTQRLAAFDQETEELEKELRGKLAQQRARILANHQRELDRHVKKWSSDAMRRQYNHASFQLRTLQKQFRLLMLECRFAEAEGIKATIDKMSENEQKDASKQMRLDFEAATAKLKAKLDVEMTSYEQRAQVQIRQLQQKRSWLRLSFLNKQRKIEQRAEQVKDQDKLWNMKQLQRKDELARGEALSKPNTAARLNEEDVKDRENPTLPLPPLHVPEAMMRTNR
ncbi:hypothetical protein TRFO_11508 [Tritrichomonas foetus]|uniref:Uncharacterized protein n=1 Tax=Tritrichomonas foetus TaxID=1144522 RepID=A0A1J4J8L7_9EUKA|nr:hypothetical protein TRFO_11508 [Tritrichomonas foetus]|eukprot:OHS93741.1 hypothetical protein TRFO_11508 [Tritrichomonas foetus]